MDFDMSPKRYERYISEEISKINIKMNKLELEDAGRLIKKNRREIAELNREVLSLKSKPEVYRREFDIECDKKVNNFENNETLIGIVNQFFDQNGFVVSDEFYGDGKSKYKTGCGSINVSKNAYCWNRNVVHFHDLGFQSLDSAQLEAFVRAFINIATNYINSSFKDIKKIECDYSHPSNDGYYNYDSFNIVIKCTFDEVILKHW